MSINNYLKSTGGKKSIEQTKVSLFVVKDAKI